MDRYEARKSAEAKVSVESKLGTETNAGLIPCIPTIQGIRSAIGVARAQGKVIGLVPTMGALHEGHLSLVRAARAECGFVVLWIFVNPTQFGPHEDLDRYPRDLERDRLLATQAGADVIFNPEVHEIYAPDHSTWVEVEGLSDGLCGASRPGHFRGVCTVVAKFLNICAPDKAYFGQKDAQQLAIVRRMVRDLNFPVEVVGCPIVREADGLALSSRNVYLTPEERREAPVLSRSLREVERLVAAGERDVATLERTLREVLATAPLAEVDYASIVDAQDLRPVTTVNGECLVAVAVRFGSTRLIDNTTVKG
jgi:pantoate--beta-alanine ligase